MKDQYYLLGHIFVGLRGKNDVHFKRSKAPWLPSNWTSLELNERWTMWTTGHGFAETNKWLLYRVIKQITWAKSIRKHQTCISITPSPLRMKHKHLQRQRGTTSKISSNSCMLNEEGIPKWMKTFTLPASSQRSLRLVKDITMFKHCGTIH